jgi:threonine/homoserine/homoserine lactone efflux protein
VVATYLAYLAVTAVLVLTPGSATAVVVRNTLAGGHRTGLMAALGAAVANATHATLAGLGLWVLVGRWPSVLDVIRVGGAAYLAWLGVRSLAGVRLRVQDRPVLAGAAAAGPQAAPALHPAVIEGLAVNLLNPAIISFYLAVVPTFVPAGAPRFAFVGLAATHVGLALACHAGWATAFHALRQVFARPGVRVTLDSFTAAAMWWLAARVLGRL